VTETATGVEQVEVRPGAYHDSVTLMQVSRAVAGVAGVLAAQVAMATDLNIDVLRGMGFTVPAGVGPGDLLIAVRAVDPTAAQAAAGAVEAALEASRGPRGGGHGTGVGAIGSGGVAAPHRTTGTAARASGAGLVLISVPGQHAFVEAMDALESGCDVMVFSDNVPLEQEVRLKDEAARRARLVMGPDCGTAVVAGVGLGFANVVRPGPVGLVAASGTGAQQVMSLLDAAGVGVRHCLGVGGRDLSAAVDGRSTRRALALLDADPDVRLIVVVSKPPDPAVEASIRELADALSTPVRLALLGPGRPDLTGAARETAEAVGATWPALPRWVPAEPAAVGAASVGAPTGHTRLRAAFAGGTLCDEAMLIAGRVLGPIASNIPLPGAPRLAADLRHAEGGSPPDHVMIDFGDDDLTRGRPHPMIDSSLRTDWLARESAAVPPGEGSVVLLDVVLGHGAHPDPAAELAPAIAAARASAAGRGARLAVVISLCGTEGDPQGLAVQAERLAASGARVYLSNAEATRAALELLTLPDAAPMSGPEVA
jgi:FdrA protein